MKPRGISILPIAADPVTVHNGKACMKIKGLTKMKSSQNSISFNKYLGSQSILAYETDETLFDFISDLYLLVLHDFRLKTILHVSALHLKHSIVGRALPGVVLFLNNCLKQ